MKSNKDSDNAGRLKLSVVLRETLSRVRDSTLCSLLDLGGLPCWHVLIDKNLIGNNSPSRESVSLLLEEEF